MAGEQDSTRPPDDQFDVDEPFEVEPVEKPSVFETPNGHVPSDINTLWSAHFAEATREEHRFSLLELAVVTGLAAALLAGLRQLGPSVAAAILGLLVLCGLLIVSFGIARARVVSLFVWILLILYLVMAGIAAMRG